MLWSLFSYALLLIFGIFLRRFLLQQFETEIIGYEGVIADIFSFIALADFGLDSLFNYRLYQAFAKEDKDRINKLANMYKLLWNLLGVAVMAMCVVLYISLPLIFKGKINNWPIFRISFILYALSVLSTYFLGYWRTILTASQKEYKAIRIETVINFVAFGCKALSLLIFKNYVLYLVLNAFFIILSKALVYFISKKEFSFFHSEKTDFSEFTAEGMIAEGPQLIMIKTADVVNWSSANLFTSLLINVSTAAMYSNYAIIGGAVWSAIASFLRPIRSTLADMLYKEEKDVSFAFYKTMDLACFFLATIMLVCYSVVFQPAIIFFFGEEFLLPMSFVYAYAFLYYLAAKSEATNSFRECFGDYKTESIFSLIAVLVMIVISTILSRLVGVGGIMISISVSYIVIWHSRKIILMKKFFKHSLLRSWLIEAAYLLLATIELVITVVLTKNISTSFMGMLIRAIIGVLIPTSINIILFRNSDLMKTVINFIKSKIFKKQHEEE